MYAAQTAVAPPTFVFFTNVATNFHFSYERFLQNRLRDAFGFFGTPIRIHVRRRAGRTKKQRSGEGTRAWMRRRGRASCLDESVVLRRRT